MEGDKLRTQFPNYNHIVEISGGKLVEVPHWIKTEYIEHTWAFLRCYLCKCTSLLFLIIISIIYVVYFIINDNNALKMNTCTHLHEQKHKICENNNFYYKNFKLYIYKAWAQFNFHASALLTYYRFWHATLFFFFKTLFSHCHCM